MLEAMSRCYPFFSAENDSTCLAEMITVFGDRAIKNVAKMLGKCSYSYVPMYNLYLDLYKMMTQQMTNLHFCSVRTSLFGISQYNESKIFRMIYHLTVYSYVSNT